MRSMLVAVALLAAASSATAQSALPGTLPDPVGFAEGQRLSGTLQLNYSEDGRNARRTAIFDNYRPKVAFNGREVVCMFDLADVRSLAPGESGPVTLECKEPVAVHRDATRLVVREGGKTVGHIDVQLPPPADG